MDGVGLVTMPDLFFNSSDFEDVVAEWAKTFGLIVFDSLAAGTVDVDENDARFAQGLRALKRVAAKSGAVFIVLHHSRKGRSDGDGGDERDMPRGTSANYAAVDVVLQLTRAEGGAFQVRQTKGRGGKGVDPFLIRVDDVDEQTTVVVATDSRRSRGSRRGRDRPAVRQREGQGRAARRPGEGPAQRDGDYRRLKGRKKTVFDAVKELEERNTITKHDGVYRLTSEVAS